MYFATDSLIFPFKHIFCNLLAAFQQKRLEKSLPKELKKGGET